jgi:GntR family transcriptional regulator/MocR family aminotransferase
MSSPVFPFKSIINFDKTSKRPIYLQLVGQIIPLISEGRLKRSSKLPSTRQLSDLLGIHRKTVVKAYEELALQGWINQIPYKGSFVNEQLPLLSLRDLKVKELNS